MLKRIIILITVLSFSVLSSFAQGNATFYFKGKIGGQFPIVMELNLVVLLRVMQPSISRGKLVDSSR